IGLAQEEDGYLYTNRTIAEMHGGEGLHPWASKNRWELDSILSHELYNAGHLFEAAVAHYQATGKKNLLDIAVKSADLIDKDFGHNKIKVYPGHQGIEMGLVKLYRATGDRRYLDLGRFFLDIRGPGGQEYNQAHKRVVDQTEATGHSVRAAYMYSGMADIAAIQGDEAYLKAIAEIWEDIVYRKMYITGGIGATGGNEGFAGPYVLPNLTAYCETCASIANIFTNHRLFLLHGRGKYIDILEKTLYNSMLSGVSLSADRFFYPNPLESDGRHERSEWFGCACCPSNIARFVPAIPGYVYASEGRDIYVNLYISNEAEIFSGKKKVNLVQQADFPWDGKVKINVNPARSGNFAIRLRIPGWVMNEAIPGDLYRFDDRTGDSFKISVNGIPVDNTPEDGYVSISRKWSEGDVIELEFPMPVRIVVADERVEEDRDRIAIQRGPVVYCAEWPDNEDMNVLDLVIDRNGPLKTEFIPSLLDGTQVIRARAYPAETDSGGSTLIPAGRTITLIPYALWNNRGPGQMRVWLPVKD
ncbi:MAG TPA: glycoside hydrolase family 127 protein, partial [Bacteroidales bacterium]|nr:glycoside hydrolase family 127 protein [Bacteroidales bacterium]